MKHLLFRLSSAFVFVLLLVGYTWAVNDPKYPYHPSQSLAFSSSNLPIVVINLNEVMASKSENRRIDAIITVVYHTDGSRNYLSDTVSSNWSNPNIINYCGHIAIKYRGNSSFSSSPKKPFSLKTRDATGSNIDVDMLGIGADKNWELLAPYNDRSMIRDVLIFDLMNPYLDYTPRGKFCELVLNGVYQGVYIMTAKVSRGDNRINIPKPGASGNNLTGGYHLEMDRNDEPVFWSNYHTRDLYGNNMSQNTCYQYKYPEYEDYQDGMLTQKNYIENRVHQMENTIAGSDFKDPERGYRKEVDVTSMIDFMLAQEFGHNVDGYRLSSPFYKYRDNVDPRFKFTIWDFNLSLGNADYYDGWSTEGWQWNMNGVPSATGDGNLIPFFFKRALEDEVFRMEMRERWAYFRATNFSEQSWQQKIDSLQTLLTEAAGRNFTIWPYWGSHVWPNYYVSQSWTDELSYLRAWTGKRIAWMDSQLLNNMPANLIKNSNFDSDMKRGPYSNDIIFSGWVLNGSVGYATTSPLNGTYNLSFRGYNASAKQTLTELDKGKYTLKAWIRTVENPQARIIITPVGATPINYPVNNSASYTQIIIPNIEVLSGLCDIEFKVTNPTYGGDTRLYLDSVVFFQQFDNQYAYHPDTKVDMPSTNLPVMMMDVTNSFATSGQAETVMTLINRANGMRNRITDFNTTNAQDSTIIPYYGNIRLELIPSSDDKKSFILYTKDNNNNYLDVNLLGLGVAHQWKLSASQDDPAFIRGIVAGELLQDIPTCKVRAAALELLINKVYQGVYIIEPQQNIAKILTMPIPQGNTATENAFVIEANNEPDFSALYPNLNLFTRPIEDTTAYGYLFPANAVRTPQMEALTTQYLHDFETAMMTGSNNYAMYIDTTAFYHYILSMELFRTAEAYRTHLAISKKSDEKMQLHYTGLLSATSNVPLYDVWSPEGWAWNFNRFDSTPSIPFWFTLLVNNKAFYQGLSHAWSLLRTSNFTDEKIDALINSWHARLGEAHARELKAWPAHTYENTYYQLDTWEAEIAAFRQFLHQRAAWLDEQFLTPLQANRIANSSFEVDAPRNNNGELLLSSWKNDPYVGGAITSNSPYEGEHAYEFPISVTQMLTQIPEGWYHLNFYYKVFHSPLIVSVYTVNTQHEPAELLFSDTLAAANEWTEVGNRIIPFDKNVGLLSFSTFSLIPEAYAVIDQLSLTFFSGLGIHTKPDAQPSSCKVYPNPFEDELCFEYVAQSSKSHIKLFSVTGLPIAQMETDGAVNQSRRVVCRIPPVASGIYFYQIQDGTAIYNGKVIKQ